MMELLPVPCSLVAYVAEYVTHVLAYSATAEAVQETEHSVLFILLLELAICI